VTIIVPWPGFLLDAILKSVVRLSDAVPYVTRGRRLNRDTSSRVLTKFYAQLSIRLAGTAEHHKHHSTRDEEHLVTRE
jgi:hypothetical protein